MPPTTLVPSAVEPPYVPQAQDTAAVPLGPPTSEIESPLPGGIDAVVRFLLGHVPQWVQIAGLVVAFLVVVTLAVVVWRRRAAIRGWFVSRPRRTQYLLAGAVGVLLVAIVGFSAASWNYIQHSNGFCVSCHVMAPAFTRFQASEHSKLECHDCHRQSIFASARQLYLWVADRPEEIGPHAKVPTPICAECHIQERPDSVWQRISATAGHRTHLASDSVALKDVQCVTCHGQEVHKFVPVDRTCGQSGCHEKVEIKLGKMAAQTSLHCVGCHNFTAPVAEHISVDSASKQLRPGQAECFSCHEMQRLLTDFNPANDPHEATCGMCHNPHTQETPRAARESCATAGCHAGADTLTPFHRGIAASTLANCTSCHRAHDWVVRGASCLTCHRDILNDGPGRTAVVEPPPRAWTPHATPLESRGSGAATTAHGSIVTFVSRQSQQPPQGTAPSAISDFSHRRHRAVECTACHATRGQRHGQLTVTTDRDCQSCHHSAEQRTPCGSCHEARELAPREAIPVQMSMPTWDAPRARTLPFGHADHRLIQCTTCHSAPLTMAVGRDCAACHQDHHRPTSDCRACHQELRRPPHTRQAHLGCAGSGCHSDASVLALRPTRNVCEGCHQNQVRHMIGRECASCHQVAWAGRR
jgi:hypothetical protein